jgi:hypothetical protein
VANDYLPVFTPGREVSLTTSATVTAGTLLEVSGSGTVGPAGAASVKVIGVAAADMATGGRVTVYGFGPVHESIADSTVTAGSLVVASATTGRQVKTLPAPAFATVYLSTDADTQLSAHDAVLGVALTTATDGNLVRWMQT